MIYDTEGRAHVHIKTTQNGLRFVYPDEADEVKGLCWLRNQPDSRALFRSCWRQ